MTHRPDPLADPGDLARPQDAPDSARRTLLRGAALLGLAGMTGTLSACGGGGSAVTSAAGPAAEPLAVPPHEPLALPPPEPAPKLPTKSDVYKRAPEPRTPKAKAEAAAKAADPATPTDVAGPPPREADLKPAAAKAEAKADAKADKTAAAKADKTVDAAEPKPGTKGEGAQPAARAPRDTGKAKNDAAPAPAPAGPPPVVAANMTGAKTSDIPVGGGRIYTAEKIVVTQPTKGDFMAFSATCTHQGCLVATIDKGAISCFGHGSQYRIADGGVVRGPALLPLPAEKITVTGETIQRG